MEKKQPKIAIIGAGPAGLTAAYLLAGNSGFEIDVFEKHPTLVGGISRTETYKGYHFDIGGHRFFSKSEAVENFWSEILGDQMLDRPRKSRIYYQQKFFDYPLVAWDALRKLGVIESALCMMSYVKARAFPIKPAKNLEDWVTNQFGERLYRIFFKTYTEKVWGVPCTEISADWAAQRIKGLSLTEAIKTALLPQKGLGSDKRKLIKTLIDSFRYPKYGPGQMWESCKEKAIGRGARVHMGQSVEGIAQVTNGTWTLQLEQGQSFEGYQYVISSAPMRHLVNSLRNELSFKCKQAANRLKYRDFLTVILILKDTNRFNDNWIYIHDPSVKVGRIQNFKSWSPYMVPNENMVCYGLEYFCFEGDGMWTMSDDDLMALARTEMAKIGLIKANEVEDGYVVRQPKAYPVYDENYLANVQLVADELNTFEGLILVGRNGMHKYNNQDHSMMTAMLAVENIKAGKQVYDLWKVNQDAEYHEAGERGAHQGGRLVPITG